MKVKDYLLEKMAAGTIHMTLIDPDKQAPERAAAIAADAEALGTDAIMIGGSTDITQKNLDETAVAIKGSVSIPVIYFPSGAHALSANCDALYFMSMLNSRDVRMVIREQAMAAPIVKKLGIEPISMGYIIVEPGMKVGEVGKADLIRRDDPMSAVGYALAAEYLGMDLVYLEAGSGADMPVPSEMVGAVKGLTSIPLIVGGGIRSAEAAKAAKDAGANAVVTGTLVEVDGYLQELEAVIASVKS